MAKKTQMTKVNVNNEHTNQYGGGEMNILIDLGEIELDENGEYNLDNEDAKPFFDLVDSQWDKNKQIKLCFSLPNRECVIVGGSQKEYGSNNQISYVLSGGYGYSQQLQQEILIRLFISHNPKQGMLPEQHSLSLVCFIEI